MRTPPPRGGAVTFGQRLERAGSEGSVRLDGIEHPVRKGTILHIPPGVVHGAVGRMRILVVGIPDISDEDLFFPND